MTIPPLHDYQQEAVRFLHERQGGAGLFLDMGLGKTCISLTALLPEHLPVLVTAPKRPAEEVWPKEVPKWRPDLRVVVARGTPAQRQRALESDADIIVIGRDVLRDAVPYAGKFNTLIIDELSGFKSRTSLRFKAAVKLIKAMPRLPGSTWPHVWGLTGTPVPNGLLDVWSQAFLLDGGSALGGKVTQYRERYFTAGRQLSSGVITEWNIRPGAEERIHTLLEPLAISMKTEGRIRLPPVTENPVRVVMDPKTRAIYKAMKQDLVADLALIGGELHSATNAATLSSKLSQICAGFMYVDDADIRDGAYTVIHQESVNALAEIVEGTGSPVVAAYRFRAEAEMIKRGLGKMVHTVDEPGVFDAWDRGKIPLLLVHPASAGHGLNLQHGGHTLVWTSLPWSLELYAQTNKRLPRQGQQHPVVIHRLMRAGGIDSAILASLLEKKSVEQALLDHLESPL